jgi:hypothetical protein
LRNCQLPDPRKFSTCGIDGRTIKAIIKSTCEADPSGCGLVAPWCRQDARLERLSIANAD